MSKLFQDFSLEDDDVLAAVAGPVGDELIEEQVVADDVAEVVADVQELEDAIETTQDAADALEQVAEFIEAKQEEGGMQEGEAEAAAIAVECILSRFNGALTIKMPATESFGAAGGRATATSYALESIKDKIKQIWAQIKKWVMQFVEKMKDWFRAHFSAAGRLQKAGSALAEKARQKVGTPEEKTFPMSGSERKYLCISPNDKEPARNIGHLETMGKDMWVDKTLVEVKEANKAIMEALREVDVDDANSLKNIEKKMPKADSFKGLVKSVSGAKGDDINWVSPDADLGATYLTVRARYAPDKVSLISCSLSRESKGGKTEAFAGEQSMKVLDTADIVRVGEAIDVIGRSIMNGQKVAGKEAETTKKAIAQLDKISAKLEGKDKDARDDMGGDKAVATIRALVKNSAAYLTANEKADAAGVTYAMTVARSWLSFGGRCLSNITDSKA